MKKTILTIIILSLNSFVLFSSQNYFFDGNNRIELRTVPTKQYIMYENEQAVRSLLQNVEQTRKGINELPSRKMRATDFRITEWSVVEASETQLLNISRNENILYVAYCKNNFLFVFLNFN